jgi:hypothetical protein
MRDFFDLVYNLKLSRVTFQVRFELTTGTRFHVKKANLDSRCAMVPPDLSYLKVIVEGLSEKSRRFSL